MVIEKLLNELNREKRMIQEQKKDLQSIQENQLLKEKEIEESLRIYKQKLESKPKTKNHKKSPKKSKLVSYI